MENYHTTILIIFITIFTPMAYMKIVGDFPSTIRKVLSMSFVLIFVFAFSFIYHMVTSKTFTESFKAAYDAAQYYEIADTPDSTGFGCVNKEQVETIAKLAEDNNIEEFKAYFLNKVESGDCTTFKENEIVKLIDTEIFTGYVLVERKNSTKQYWSDISFLKEK